MSAERAGRKAEATTRRCIVSRATAPREALIRFVAGPDGEVVPDLAETLPGRGLWLAAEKDIVARAVSRNAFSRAAGMALSAPADLAERVERLLVRRCSDLIGLARRAGQLVAGFDGVQAALRAGGVDLLLTAVDSAGRDGRELAARGAGCRRLRVLTAAEQGMPLDRDHAVHLALKPGSLSDTLWREGRRLAGFRDGATAEPAAMDDEDKVAG